MKKLIAKVGGIALSLSVITSFGQSAYAEGSRSLYPSGYTGSRANIEWRTSFYAGGLLKRRTLLKVYANAGEYILLGSSAVGNGSSDIKVYDPNTVTGVIGQETIPGTANFSCAAQRTATANPNQGRITTRTIELTGPDTITNPTNATRGGAFPTGYVPCFYQAPSTGIYNVVFYGTSGDGQDDQFVSPNGNIGTPQTNTSTSVAAWDVTVRSSLTSTTDINGRLFADYLAMFTGANGRPVNSQLFIVTQDGFRYLTDLKGIDPNGFVLLANNIGFYDSDGQTPLYRDLVSTTDQLTNPQGGVTLARPNHLIFFTNTNNSLYQPDSTAIVANNIPLTPTAPTLSSFTYTGSAGGIDSFVNSGGTFSITTNVDSTYEIIISRNGIDFDPTNPNNRVLRGVRSAGISNVTWNGLDNSGVAFPVGTYSSKAQIHAGEYHFPLLDAENSTSGGPTYTLFNPPSGDCTAMGASGCSTAYYDDRGYRTLNGTTIGTVNVTLPTGTPSNPSSAVLGFNSVTSTQRSFSNNFGDKRGLDLWTFFPSTAQTVSVNIIAQPSRDVTISKSHVGDFNVGANGVYTLQVRNTGSSAIASGETITVTDTLPAGLSFVSGTGTGWTCSASGQVVTCTNTSGLAAGTNAAPIALTVSVSATTADVVTNTATVSVTTPTTNDSDPDNNTATDPTNIVKPDLTVLKVHTGNFTRGSSGSYSITVKNANPVATTGTVNLTDTLPTGLAATAISGTGWTCTLATLTCTRSDSLAGNSDYPPITLTVLVLGNAPNTLTNEANVSGGGESNTSNNTATDVTTIDGPILSGKLLLVKRITAINGVAVTGFSPDGTGNDTNVNWPSPNTDYLRGAIACPSTSPVVCAAPAPTQTIEYTIYFLSSGNADATNVTICDLVPLNTTFVSGAYGSNQDIAFLNSASLQTTPSAYLTGLSDSDRGQFYQPNVLPPTTCKKPITNELLTAADNTNGLVAVDVVKRITAFPAPPTEVLPFATGPGTPANSYGFVRFTVKVN